jgi:hypothetical protein
MMPRVPYSQQSPNPDRVAELPKNCQKTKITHTAAGNCDVIDSRRFALTDQDCDNSSVEAITMTAKKMFSIWRANLAAPPGQLDTLFCPYSCLI